MAKLAIMQPYFFPYMGYWQLIQAVDRFVIYDDVNYIKGGWINRNRIPINGEPAYITAPLQQPSPFRRICDISLLPSVSWRDKLVKMVELTYRNAPCFPEVFPVIETLLRHDTDNLSGYLAHQLQTLASFMGIRTEFVMSSRGYHNDQLTGQERVLDICKREGAHIYINAQGGRTLYEYEAFHRAGIDLTFIIMQPLSYTQRTAKFVPNLSIIDALMSLGPVEIRPYLGAFDLISDTATHAH
ncbi:MAG TPA: WbqC family protein [Thiobacillus sp.]|jgi:hypothetical protein|nr:WbqC family protein [Thiobacillus sp.]